MFFPKPGTAEMASDPMPPNVSDTFVMLHPSESWPNPKETKLELIENIETALRKLPGNNYEFTQPIEMRFNELIAGVRSDVAVKIYGDNFDTMQKPANPSPGFCAQFPEQPMSRSLKPMACLYWKSTSKKKRLNSMGFPLRKYYM